MVRTVTQTVCLEIKNSGVIQMLGSSVDTKTDYMVNRVGAGCQEYTRGPRESIQDGTESIR